MLAPVLLRSLTGPDGTTLRSAVEKYKAATKEVQQRMDQVAPEKRVCGMNSHPRMTRYVAMGKVYKAVHKLRVPKEYWFSCVNLSYDYNEKSNSCSLRELEATASIIAGFLVSYFQSLGECPWCAAYEPGGYCCS